MAMNPTESPILITGIGACGAGGADCEELWDSCRRGRSMPQMREVSGLQIPVYRSPEPSLSRWDAHLVRSAVGLPRLALVRGQLFHELIHEP